MVPWIIEDMNNHLTHEEIHEIIIFCGVNGWDDQLAGVDVSRKRSRCVNILFPLPPFRFCANNKLKLVAI